jgi:Fuseless
MHMHFAFRDWIYSLTIGILVVSYWRCSWTLLDILGCDQPTTATLARGDTFCFALTAALEPDSNEGRIRLRNAAFSYAAGIVLLLSGIALIMAGFWLPNRTTMIITLRVGICRFVIVYILGASAVNIWRGIWYWLDAFILPSSPLASYWATSIAGAGAAFATFTGSSLLAPPALFLLDGPDTDPPPIAVTALNAHFSVTLPSGKERPRLAKWVGVMDCLFTFGFVPIVVVSFWRGSWLLLDHYFWGFTESKRDVRLSLIGCMLMFIMCIWLTSEPVVGMIDRKLGKYKLLLGLLGRIRTYVLAWGTVSFWRCFWLVWDEFLGGSTLLSVVLGHIVSIVALLSMGCMSCINAPASTVGVDSVPDVDCEDDPLFSMVPLPWDTLYAFGMFRQIDRTQPAFESKSTHDTVDSPHPAPSAGDIEMMAGRMDPLMDSTTTGAPENEVKLPMLTDPSMHRSWRPGLIRTDEPYRILRLDLVQPGLRHPTVTNYLQRPGDTNVRWRSRLFKNRGNNTRK